MLVWIWILGFGVRFFLLLSYAQVGMHLVLPISSFVCSSYGKQFPKARNMAA